MDVTPDPGEGAHRCPTEGLRHYLPLIRSIVEALSPSLPANVQRDDLESAGLRGLHRCLGLQRPWGSPQQFEAYARLRIRGAMLDELRTQDWLSRRTRARRERGAPIPSFFSLEDAPEAERHPGLGAVQPSPLEELLRRQELELLRGALERLPTKQRWIIERHYLGESKLTELAEELGLSLPRVSQLHTDGLLRLRTLLGRAA